MPSRDELKSFSEQLSSQHNRKGRRSLRGRGSAHEQSEAGTNARSTKVSGLAGAQSAPSLPGGGRARDGADAPWTAPGTSMAIRRPRTAVPKTSAKLMPADVPRPDSATGSRSVSRAQLS